MKTAWIKRVLSAVLAVLMLLTAMPVSAHEHPTVEFENAVFTVQSMDDRRIESVHIEVVEKSEEDDIDIANGFTVHGFTIDKVLQKGAMTGFVYRNAPKNIFHSWVEVYFEERWYELEAFILDRQYLEKLQAINAECTGAFCGYGVAVSDFRHPVIDFDRNNTYIQSEGINQDFGVYDSPDELLKKHHQELSAVKKLAFRYYGRHMMNRNVKKIRNLSI